MVNPSVFCPEKHMKNMKRELPRSIGAQYATGDQWRNNSRKKEGKEPKGKKKQKNKK